MTVVHLWRGNEKRHTHRETLRRHGNRQTSSRQGWLQLDILVLTSALRTSRNTLLLFRSPTLRHWQEDHSKMIWLRMKEKKKNKNTYTLMILIPLRHTHALLSVGWMCSWTWWWDQLIPCDEMLCLGEPCMRTKIEEKWNEGKDSWALLGEREKGELPDHHFK